MCDSNIKSLLLNLSTTDTNKRIIAVKNFIDKLKETNKLCDIIKSLLKYIGTVEGDGRQGYLEGFHWILESANEDILASTILQMKEVLFNNKIKDATKKEISSNKLGSILAFDVFITSMETSKVNISSLEIFYKFIINLVDNASLGFLATVTLINFFKKISLKDFESVLCEMKNDFFIVENLDNHPQYLLLWLSFTNEQKKILKKCSKMTPVLQSKEVLTKIPNLLKICKADQLITIFNHLTATPDFPIVWKNLSDLFLQKEPRLKDKQIILSMAFESVCPLSNGVIINLTKEKRISLLNKIWNDKIILKLLLKQLSETEYELHNMCQDFIVKLNKLEMGKVNKIFLEQLFKNVLELGQDLVEEEYKISQTLRLSNCLLRYVESEEIYNSYIEYVKTYLNSTDKCHQKIYALEQLSGAFVKCPVRNDSVVEFLLNINYEFNYKNNALSQSSEAEAARSALLRCLNEIIVSKDLDQSKRLLESTMKIFQDKNLINKCRSVLEFWESSSVKSKKRSASKRNNENDIDLSNNANKMFISLLAHLCFYMTTQIYDEETLEMFDDVRTCFDEFRNAPDIEISNKRIKINPVDIGNIETINKDWKIVLSDVLIVLLEQNCHYLRTLSANTFKILVTENLCDKTVMEHVNMAIENSENQSKNIDKKESIDENAVEEDESDSDDDSGDEEEEKKEMDVENTDDMKARIFSALGSVVADVNSDSDDNCPEVNESDSSDDNEDESQSKIKISLKEKRHTLLQLKQFRNRCIDLLETAFLHAPDLSDRLVAFSLLMKRVQKSHQDIEIRLLKSVSAFKKYQPTSEVTVADIVGHINDLLDGVGKCNLSKNVLQIFGDMIVAFLKMKKSELSKIVESFKPIIERCIVEKKMHPMKAIFLKAFDIFPEICWAFHSELMKFINAGNTDQAQYQAACILRQIITNKAIKDIVRNENGNSFVNKEDILHFVNTFGDVLQASIVNSELESHPKNAALFIGCLTDCLKLGAHAFYQKINTSAIEKIKAVKSKSNSKDLKKTINQFVAATDFAKKSVNK